MTFDQAERLARRLNDLVNRRTGMGQTTSGASAADLEAMNAPASRLPELCRQGNALACRLANIPVDTPEAQAQRATERDRQAVAEREALAARALSAGVNPLIATAIRTGRDVQYAPAASAGRTLDVYPDAPLAQRPASIKAGFVVGGVLLACGGIWFAWRRATVAARAAERAAPVVA